MTKNELKQKIEEKTKELEELKKIYKEEICFSVIYKITENLPPDGRE